MKIIKLIQQASETGKSWQNNKRLEGKTAIVTGGSSGIGKCVVLDLYRRGARVIVPCLEMSEGENVVASIKGELKDAQCCGELVLKHLDLSSLDSVARCAKELLDEERYIHMLINNAGVFICDQMFSKDGYQIHFAVNYLGHFLFTVLLMPVILRSAPARILNISSDIHILGKPFDLDYIRKDVKSPLVAYINSKFAVASFTKELSRKLEGTGVCVYSAHPGIVDTPMSDRVLASCNIFLRTLIKMLAKPIVKTPSEAAQTLLYCAIEEELEFESGYYYAECKRRGASTKCEDVKIGKALWDLTMKILDLDSTNPFQKTE